MISPYISVSNPPETEPYSHVVHQFTLLYTLSNCAIVNRRNFRMQQELLWRMRGFCQHIHISLAKKADTISIRASKSSKVEALTSLSHMLQYLFVRRRRRKDLFGMWWCSMPLFARSVSRWSILWQVRWESATVRARLNASLSPREQGYWRKDTGVGF